MFKAATALSRSVNRTEKSGRSSISIAVDGILHARLHDGSRLNGSMTIAAGVLTDPRFWTVALPI
jgi:hypothetical protein